MLWRRSAVSTTTTTNTTSSSSAAATVTGSFVRKPSLTELEKVSLASDSIPEKWKDWSTGFLLITSKKVVLIIICLGLVIFGVITWVFREPNGSIQDLRNVESKVLNQTLSSSDFNSYNLVSYFFYCFDKNYTPASTRKTNLRTTNDNLNMLEMIPKIFIDFHYYPFPFAIKFAVLNCSRSSHLIPGNISIYEQFALDQTLQPVIWGKAPWNHHHRIHQIHPRYLDARYGKSYTKRLKSLREFGMNYFAPLAIEIDRQTDLEHYCRWGKQSRVYEEDPIASTCIILMKGSEYQEDLYLSLEYRLVSTYPQIRFGSIDGTDYVWNHEEDIMNNSSKVFPYGLKVKALRYGTHYLDMITPITWENMNTFVSRAITVPTRDYLKSEKEKVQLVSIVVPPGKPKTRQERNRVKKARIGKRLFSLTKKET